MKIKRYVAASMRAALAQVRAEQGPEAVILSSRRVEEGMEVIAAVDYDEALFVGVIRQAPALTSTAAAADARAEMVAVASAAVAPVVVASTAPQAVAPTAAKPTAATPTAAAPPTTAPVALPPAATAVEDTDLRAVRREISDLRSLLARELASLAPRVSGARASLRTRVLEELESLDVAPDVARKLAALTPERSNVKDPTHIPIALLVKHLPVVEDLSTVNPGVIAVVGPTGVGKTTTIAKLAARWTLRHGSQDVALVSTDCYRIGAREQLATYARLLGVSMHVANSGPELELVLKRLRDKKLVLIDTAGVGPTDVRLGEQLSALRLGAAGARVLLALPATAEGHALEQMVRAFARVAPCACVLTKVDEAASLGAALSIALRHGLKLAYVCDGQRVPEDVHSAHRRRIWLVKTALYLRARVPVAGRASQPARSGGTVHAHG